jgi:histidinol phosphatase-like PHP family hydrolase
MRIANSSRTSSISRRTFLAGAACCGLAGSPDLPLVDYHVHLDETVTLERALELSRERGVKFGIVEHAGTKENRYAGLLSSDADLLSYLARLEAKPVYRGIQAEGLDWMTCFSPRLVARLDYTLSDALTFPEQNGVRVELWRPWVTIDDSEDFMERYTAFHIEVLEREPIDILANPSFLPACIDKLYDSLWTTERIERVVNAAVRNGVAIEINSRYALPRRRFLRVAREKGARFSFGSNIHGPGVGMLDYCLEAARELGLTRGDLFTPAAAGSKPIERRLPSKAQGRPAV